jgi:hypothetical protein
MTCRDSDEEEVGNALLNLVDEEDYGQTATYPSSSDSDRQKEANYYLQQWGSLLDFRQNGERPNPA